MGVGAVRVSFLDGKGLATKLPKLVGSCDTLDIAMAYVKLGALVPLLDSFNGLLNRKGSLRMVFGLSSHLGITDTDAAKELLRLSRRKNASIHKNNNPGFHPKLFIFHGEHSAIAVGSANLTKGAQTSNAEANILLEDVEPAVMDDASDFFNDCFRDSPALRRRHVNEYRGKQTGGWIGKRGSGEGLDPLPRFGQQVGEMGAAAPREFWKISPGENAWYWDEWFNEIDDLGNGIVAIGWDVGNLNRIQSSNSLKAAVERYKLRRHEDFYVKTTADQLWTFKRLPEKEGAVILVYSEGRVLGITQITKNSTYAYKGIKSISYEHQINVKYLWFDEWPKEASRYLKKELGKQGTLLRVENQRVWREVLRCVRTSSSKGTSLSRAVQPWGLGALPSSIKDFPYGYVFPHTPENLPEGPASALKEAAKEPRRYWHHGETAKCPEGGFKLVVGFNKKIHGEFQVEERLPSNDKRWRWQYLPKPGTFYLYKPPVDSKKLVNNYWRREGFTARQYDRFLGKTSLIPP